MYILVSAALLEIYESGITAKYLWEENGDNSLSEDA